MCELERATTGMLARSLKTCEIARHFANARRRVRCRTSGRISPRAIRQIRLWKFGCGRDLGGSRATGCDGPETLAKRIHLGRETSRGGPRKEFEKVRHHIQRAIRRNCSRLHSSESAMRLDGDVRRRLTRPFPRARTARLSRALYGSFWDSATRRRTAEMAAQSCHQIAEISDGAKHHGRKYVKIAVSPNIAGLSPTPTRLSLVVCSSRRRQRG